VCGDNIYIEVGVEDIFPKIMVLSWRWILTRLMFVLRMVLGSLPHELE